MLSTYAKDCDRAIAKGYRVTGEDFERVTDSAYHAALFQPQKWIKKGGRRESAA